MNREILFRGKRVDNGGWTYGYLFKMWDRSYIQWGTTNNIPNMIEVFPATVGQFTGLFDMDGNRIWEGDIIDSWAGVTDDNEMYIRTVVFNDDYGILELKPGTGYTLCKTNTETLFKVIGNIHEER